MAKPKKSRIWTICYALWEDDDCDDPWTATWFAYGKDKAEATAHFLEDFHSHPEDFYGATEKTHITVCNVFPGFSC